MLISCMKWNERIIKEHLSYPQVDDKTMRRRRALFEEYVSPPAGCATELSPELIRSLARCVRGI